jgi:lipid-A-disaccharide synthase
MKTMQRIADRVLVIFPFEEDIYRRAHVPVEWVGHPLLDVSPEPRPRAAFLESLGLDPRKRLVAILPGSRINEVRAILPGLLAAAAIIHRRLPDTQFVLARAPHLGDDLFSDVGKGPAITMVENATDDVLASADLGLLASGTVTVQAALRECPMIVVYRLSPLTYRLGRRFVHVSTFAMANLVAGRAVVPEFEQDEFTPEAVAAEALALLESPERVATMRAELRQVRAKLGSSGASRRAAAAVLAVARAKAARRLG